MKSTLKIIVFLFCVCMATVSMHRFTQSPVVYRGKIVGDETEDEIQSKVKYWKNYAKEHKVMMCIDGVLNGEQQRCNFEWVTIIDFPEQHATRSPTYSPIDYDWFGEEEEEERVTSILLDLRPHTLVHSSFYVDELKKYDNPNVYVLGKSTNHPVLSLRGDYNFITLEDAGELLGVAPEIIISGVDDDLFCLIQNMYSSSITTPKKDDKPTPLLRVVSSNWVGIDRVVYTMNLLSDNAYHLHTGFDPFLDDMVEAYNLTNIVDVSQQISSEDSVLLYFWANPFSVCKGDEECVRGDLQTTIQMLEGFGNPLVFNLDELVYHEEDYWERMIPFLEKQGFDIRIFIDGYPSTSYVDFESDIFLDYLANWDLESFYEKEEPIPGDIRDMMEEVESYVISLN